MGKGILLILAAAIVGSTALLYQTERTTVEADHVQSKQQEKVLAREIARSAYNAASSKAREMDAADEDVEDIVAEVGTFSDPMTGSYQGGQYEYWAELVAGSTYRIGATGMYGDASYTLNGTRSSEDLLLCEKEGGCTLNLSLDGSTAGYCSAVFVQRYIPKDNSGHGNNYDHDDSDNRGSGDPNGDDDEMQRGSFNSIYRKLKPDLVFKPGHYNRNGHLDQTYDQTLEENTRFNIILAVDQDCSMEGEEVSYDADFDYYRMALAESVGALNELQESSWAITEEHAEESGKWRLGYEDLPDSRFSEQQLVDVKENGYPPTDDASRWDGETYGGDGWSYENDGSGFIRYWDQSEVPDFDDQVMTVWLSPTGAA